MAIRGAVALEFLPAQNAIDNLGDQVEATTQTRLPWPNFEPFLTPSSCDPRIVPLRLGV
jgi:hypothetical protein